jgi:hypothetical protein
MWVMSSVRGKKESKFKQALAGYRSGGTVLEVGRRASKSAGQYYGFRR